jgi:serine/threonine-protein kinase RsbW
MNKRGELISSVAVNEETNEIMSHAAIEVTEGTDLVELGVAFTKPQFRHQGCFNNICDFLMDEAKREGIKGVYATAVTIHPFSQKAILKNNFKESGILVGLAPASTFKESLEHGQQRESMIILFRPIEQLPEQILYAPTHHKEILQKIYNNIGVAVKWQQQPDVSELSGKHAAIEVKVHGPMEEADIYVNEYGSDVVDEVHHRLRELIREKIEAIYLHLDLRDPLTAHFTKEFEKIGFFFSGVLPCGLRQNLILQVIDADVDYDKIQTASEFSAELLSYVKKCNAALA